MEAEQAYHSLLELAPTHAQARANLGAVLMRLGRYEEAVSSYESALNLDSTLVPVKLNIGIAHYRMGEFERAITTFQEFLSAAPGHLQAMQLLGLSLVELGRDAEATAFLGRALQGSPDDPAVLYGLGLAHLRLKRPDVDAIAEKLGKVPEGRPASHLLRGQAFLAGLEYERALEELRIAAAISPDLPRLHYSLGLSYFKLGRREDALRAFEAELRRRPKDSSTLYYIAYLLEETGDLPGARASLLSAVAIDPHFPEADALMGKILIKEGKTLEALAPLEKAVATDPEDSEKRYLLARAYQQAGRREDAEREFSEVQRLKARQLQKDRSRLPPP